MIETSELQAYLFIDVDDSRRVVVSTPELFPTHFRLPVGSIQCDEPPTTPWSASVKEPTATQRIHVPTWRLRNRRLRRPTLTFRQLTSTTATYEPTRLTPAALSILLFCCRRFPDTILQHSRLPGWIRKLPLELFDQLKLFSMTEPAKVTRARLNRLQDEDDFFFRMTEYACDFASGRVDIPAGLYIDTARRIISEDNRRLNVLEIVIQQTPNLWKSRHLPPELKLIHKLSTNLLATAETL